jgi:4-hydroxybenzoate polyprenyltransferase
VSLVAAIRSWGRMVKLSHTLFALPFALAGAALAAAQAGIGWRQVLWIVVAMTGARNAAMGFNRLADHVYDARNPRTANRELPSGELSRRSVWGATALLAAVFVFASFQLSPLCGWLSPAALAIVCGYSYTKRFTWASHLVLGLALALAPVAGWLAVSGGVSAAALLLGLAVLIWVAGFDVLYACQDVEFDRQEGLFSIPARFGLRPALALARLLHAGSLAALAGVGLVSGLHPVYWVGLAVIAGVLAWEHRLVRPDDLSRLDVAFFRMNGMISVIYLATILAAVLLPLAGAG